MYLCIRIRIFGLSLAFLLRLFYQILRLSQAPQGDILPFLFCMISAFYGIPFCNKKDLQGKSYLFLPIQIFFCIL